VSLGSLRVYGLTEKTTRDAGRVRKSGFTVAPEAGTQRLRDVVNKGISQEDIEKAATAAFSGGWERIKLYFMCGLPTETREDLDGILERCKEVLRIGKECRAKGQGDAGKRRKVQVSLSVSSFIPKPFSSFQWWGMDTEEVLEEKQAYVRRRLPRGVQLSRHHVGTSVLEGILARGDRRLGRVIERAWREGARFDGWDEWFRRDLWDAALEAEGIDPQVFLRELEVDAPLPWDHIDCLVTKEYLVKDYRKAFKNRYAPACEKPYKGFQFPEDRDEKLVCYFCGLDCDLKHIYTERKRERNLLQLLPSPGEAAAPPAPLGVDQAHGYRCRFTKLGRARFLSHLDLMRTLQRALRRAGVPLLLTQGFNPKPVMAFGPALALGVESAEEHLDFHSRERLDPEAVLSRVNGGLPEGLRLLSMEALPHRSPALTTLFDRAVYSVVLDREAAGGPEEQRRLVEAFNRRESVRVERQRKGKTRVQDLKQFVGEVESREVAGSVRLTIPVRVGQSGSARPEDVLQAIYGRVPAHGGIRRERLLRPGQSGPRAPSSNPGDAGGREPVESGQEGASA
jgi:radical SAM-linked protein